MPEISGTTVTRPLTEPMLENGQVQLGPREAETLGLPAHSGQVTCHYDGETFPADWQARDRVLAGEILQETLSLYGRLGGLLRLQASSTGLELDIVSPSSSTVLAHAASLSSAGSGQDHGLYGVSPEPVGAFFQYTIQQAVGIQNRILLKQISCWCGGNIRPAGICSA